MHIAQVIVDIPAKEISTSFDYEIPPHLDGVSIGSCVLVDFGNRPVVGYVVGLSSESEYDKLKPIRALLGGPYFDEAAAQTAQWIAREYVSPLSEAIKLFTPPGGTPKAVKVTDEAGNETWELKRPGVGAVDDRWVSLTPAAEEFQPAKNATMQRAVIQALSAGPVRVAELAGDLGSVDGAIKKLADLGVVEVERRRRMRSDGVGEGVSSRHAPRHEKLTDGQAAALKAIEEKMAGRGGVVVMDGVTGSGKTEVYLRAIEEVLAAGGGACVLVPEISLTPQTVGRFRSRFGDKVAVLHSRLSPGERFDQWDQIASGQARLVVGARSALFAPIKNIQLIVIDEEHEHSYKQGQAPRYHARDVAAHMAKMRGITLVLGSASPSLETQAKAARGEWTLVELPERVGDTKMPEVTVVDMTAEFESGHRSMFSRALTAALEGVIERKEKAVLFLNRRGFASFVLCRECGYVPECPNCSVSLTYHEAGGRLVCHHCGQTHELPSVCPQCGSPYLRQFGTGTQRVEAELRELVGPDVPIIRMDADTTKGKGAHEKLLLEFEAARPAILLGTQMIAKGLDYPDVTLVGVLNADTTLRLPDFRAGERTWQLLEQVAGRAGRGEVPGHVIIQTYWADHPAVRAVAAHDRTILRDEELEAREELGYPPFGRLANVLIWGKNERAVVAEAKSVGEAIAAALTSDKDAHAGWQMLGPSACVLERLKGAYRWHILLKAPNEADIPGFVLGVLESYKRDDSVSFAVDIDPVDLM